MDDEYDEEEFVAHSFPWSWRSSAVALGDFVTNVLNDTASLVRHVTLQIAADHNYRIDRQHFQEEAARAIETITGEE